MPSWRRKAHKSKCPVARLRCFASRRHRLKECATKTKGVCDMTVLDQFRLDGKCILVTGGSRGFGRAIALAAAEAGADVMLVARDPDALARTADEVRERGRKAWTFAADIAEPTAHARIFAAARSAKGRPSIFSSTMSAVVISTLRSRIPTSRLGSASSTSILRIASSARR